MGERDAHVAFSLALTGSRRRVRRRFGVKEFHSEMQGPDGNDASENVTPVFQPAI